MDRTERFYKIDQLLQNAKSVPISRFLEVLEVSLPTFKRDMAYMRERLNAPIIWNRSLGGYSFAHQTGEIKYELPGLWLNAGEIYALLTMQHLLSELQPSMLGGQIQPLQSRLNAILDREGLDLSALQQRIKIVRMGRKLAEPAYFSLLAHAVLQRKQLKIQYYNRQRDSTEERILSPQRLLYYRDNWYCDAWCPLRQALRSFALDAMRSVEILNETALNLSEEVLSQYFNASYGIFSGAPIATAALRFLLPNARYVAQEIWHPEQVGAWQADGSYILHIPYSHAAEIKMDILRHGAKVQVLSPAALRAEIQQECRDMQAYYSENSA